MRKRREKHKTIPFKNRGTSSFNRKKLNYLLLFMLGFLILAYPIVSEYYYKIGANKSVQHFEEGAKSLQPSDVQDKIALAKAYNQSLTPAKLLDPYQRYSEKEGLAEYARMLEINELIGHVEIPKINQDLPIFAGTSDQVLEKGSGHMEGTSLPIGGENTHTVITAHRGLPSAYMFRYLNEMEEGDVFYIHNIEGVLAYEVDLIQTVEPSYFDPVLVQEGKDYATLLTCTPYMINSDRLLVRGHRIPYIPEDKKEDEGTIWRMDRLYIWIGIVIFVAILLLVFALKK